MITNRLHYQAKRAPERPFVLFEGQTVTYGEMAESACAVSALLAARGIGPGSVVALLSHNHPAFLTVWFALADLGAITVPLNTALVGDGLRYILSQSGASAILGDRDLLEAKSSDLRAVLEQESILSLDAVLSEASSAPRCARPNLQPGAPCCILYTSGTTGLPKGAVISHSCYEQAGRDMTASLNLTREDRILVFLPLFHANPQMYAVMSALEVGASLALQRKFSATDFFSEAKRLGATGFTYVGTVLSILEKRVPGPATDHGLKWCVGGGAPSLVWKAIEERFNVPVRELYGMTETGGWVSMNTAEAMRFGSVGWPRDAVEIAIVDEHDEPLPPGEKGEIVVRSRRPFLLFDGYWKRPELTVEATRNLWLHTGDRGWLDEDGFLFFDGRFKELIRRAGEMISPVEIELQLLKHPLIRDCAVVGVADEILGEEIKVAIVAERPFDVAEVRSCLRGKVADYMIPRYVEFLDALPKTETEKVQRHKLASLTSETVDLKLVASS